MHRLGLDLHSFREPLTRSIRLVMMPSIAKNFDEEGRPEKWEELAQYTVQVRGDAHPILTRTGALKRAASSFTIWSVGSASATIRSLPPHVWYGYLHQEGYGSIRVKALRMLGGHGTEKEIAKVSNYIAQQAEKKRGASKFAIPQREFILFQREDIEMVQEVFIEWMEAQADKVGRGWAGR
jgi:phage gpG-like protein